MQGSSKPGTIGEISIDFADYAEATKPLSISLPLKNSDSNAVLHVSTLLLSPLMLLSVAHINTRISFIELSACSHDY